MYRISNGLEMSSDSCSDNIYFYTVQIVSNSWTVYVIGTCPVSVQYFAQPGRVKTCTHLGHPWADKMLGENCPHLGHYVRIRTPRPLSFIIGRGPV